MVWAMACIFLLLFLVVPYSAGAETGGVLTLREGLQLVTENSRLLRIAEQEELAAEADSRLSMARLMPVLSTSLGYSFLMHQPKAIFGPQTVPVSERNFAAFSLLLRQTLYDFQGDRSRHEADEVLRDAKRLETGRVKNLAAIEFVLSYFNLLEAEKMLLVSLKEVERLEGHLRDAGSLYEEGMITKNDLLQAEVRLSDARQRMLTARYVREISESRLNNVLARPLKEKVQIEEVPLDASVVDEADLEIAWKAAESQRLELQVLDRLLKSLEWEEKAKRAEYFPKFYFRGGYEYAENRYQVHEGNWTAVLGMDLTLFSGGSTRAEAMKLGAAKMKIRRQREKLLEEIRLEVERAFLEVMTARRKSAVAAAAVAQAEENLRINRVRYEEGTGTATEVLDAISLLTVAETNHYRARYELQKAGAAVVYATGKPLTEVYR